MTVQQPKRRPLSRYLKDFKHTQTHCAHCGKLLDRITLTCRGEIVNKTTIAQLDTLIDDAAWQVEKQAWTALCRFCGDLHCKEQGNYFDIIGFKQYLFEQTEMSHGTIREYVVRLRRLGNHLSEQAVSAPSLLQSLHDDTLDALLPQTSTNNYRIALRKYWQFQMQLTATPCVYQENHITSDIY
ncbi:flagella biosynthesis regulatory protein FliZ [Dryocola sp. BD613]|uniref:flagella biosynthesis regulatory protein FliZ n=1 Tax=Dryocola sp. BD613 TaxID=3133272 RepID=UPI003F4FA66A